jgi:hypothetical protein
MNRVLRLQVVMVVPVLTYKVALMRTNDLIAASAFFCITMRLLVKRVPLPVRVREAMPHGELHTLAGLVRGIRVRNTNVISKPEPLNNSSSEMNGYISSLRSPALEIRLQVLAE